MNRLFIDVHFGFRVLDQLVDVMTGAECRAEGCDRRTLLTDARFQPVHPLKEDLFVDILHHTYKLVAADAENLVLAEKHP